MQLRSGQIYLDRSGERVGPLDISTKRPDFPWYIRIDKTKIRTFTATGCYHSDGRESPYDLVSEVVASEEKEPVAIDLAGLDHMRRGVSRIWDTYKLLP